MSKNEEQELLFSDMVSSLPRFKFFRCSFHLLCRVLFS